jgi:hypothetical protein
MISDTEILVHFEFRLQVACLGPEAGPGRRLGGPAASWTDDQPASSSPRGWARMHCADSAMAAACSAPAMLTGYRESGAGDVVQNVING